MKYLRVYAAIMCLLSQVGIAQLAHAQSDLSDSAKRRLSYDYFSFQQNRPGVNDHCILNGEQNYSWDYFTWEPSRSGRPTNNTFRCIKEGRYCLGSDFPKKEEMQQPSFQRCANELWSLVGKKDWDGW